MLRDYQQTVYDGVRKSFRQGNKKPLVVLPCGAGKSYIFTEMAKNCNGDVLILTHRKELLNQHNELLKNLGISNTRVAMVLTEKNHLGEYPVPKLIITDESHLSISNSWVTVLNYYNTSVVGFTATPIRLDGKPLGDIYDDMVEGVNVKWLIENNRLRPFEYYAPVEVDTDNLKIVNGDYVTSDLEKIMMNKGVYGDVLKSWQEIAENEKTIAYCVSVKHAQEMAQMFIDNGYSAVEIDGSTPQGKREQIMLDFRNGKITILCNVGIISEGVSIDDVNCCLLLRPTESHRLYWQQAMRCMRYQPNKVAKIIDCVGNYTRNPMPDEEVEWSLVKRAKKRQRTNENGDFFLRTCPECFRAFHTAPICPYCGAVYPLQAREIKAHEEIKLRQIQAEERQRIEAERKQLRKEQGRAQSFEQLIQIGRQRGYKNPAGWAYMVMKGRKKI